MLLKRFSQCNCNRLKNFTRFRQATSLTKNLIPIRTSLKSDALLQQPQLNKGSAFTREEREIFEVDGHIPYDVHSLEKQMVRAYAQFKRQPSNLLKVSLLYCCVFVCLYYFIACFSCFFA